ncbi:MAG: porin [Duodenibacillus massiliensis]
MTLHTCARPAAVLGISLRDYRGLSPYLFNRLSLTKIGGRTTHTYARRINEKVTLLQLQFSAPSPVPALAADVTLYGVVDLGLQYTHSDPDTAAGATDKLQMASGSEAGPRFGLKGVEQLGNGVEVGFVLENGFSADTGASATTTASSAVSPRSLFAVPSVKSPSAAWASSRAATAPTSLPATSLLFGTSWGGSVEGSTYMVGYNRMDNTVVYKTPTFGGFTVYAQYSSDMNTLVQDTTENKGNSNRYYALGATFNAGALNLVGTVDSYNWDSSNGKMEQLDDGLPLPSAVPMTSVLPRPTSVLSTLTTC